MDGHRRIEGPRQLSPNSDNGHASSQPYSNPMHSLKRETFQPLLCNTNKKKLTYYHLAFCFFAEPKLACSRQVCGLFFLRILCVELGKPSVNTCDVHIRLWWFFLLVSIVIVHDRFFLMSTRHQFDFLHSVQETGTSKSLTIPCLCCILESYLARAAHSRWTLFYENLNYAQVWTRVIELIFVRGRRPFQAIKEWKHLQGFQVGGKVL